MKFKFLIVLLISFTNFFSQELPPINNFSLIGYNAQNQNWSITQSNDGSIFVANNKGLLIYNGSDWNLINSPNNTIIRSVKAIDDRIYTGSYMEFGYWKKDRFNQMIYISLSNKIRSEILEDEQIWNIIDYEGKVLFQSLNNIYLYDSNTETINTIVSQTDIVKLYKTNQSIFFQEKNKGLFKVENGRESLLSDNDVFIRNRIINVFELKIGLLIHTQDEGFFLLEDNKVSSWKTEIDNMYPNISIYSSKKLENGNIILGSISKGVFLINENGEILYNLDQLNGLNDNTILSIYEDRDRNIWLGLDSGISVINQESAIKKYNDVKGSIGSVYASAIYKDKLYLGTNQGLFFRKIKGNDDLKFIKGTQGQVWSLNIIDNTLFCGHNSGTIIINDDTIDFILDVDGTWQVKPFGESKNKLLKGNYSGLYVLEKKNDKWVLKNKIQGFDISSRYFEIIGNEIFVSHEYKGVYKLKVDKDFKTVKKNNKLPISKGANSSLAKYLGDIYYAYEDGIFKYDRSQEIFIKDTLLSTIYKDDYISGKLIISDFDNEMWAFSDSKIVKISQSKLSNDLNIKELPISNSMRNGLVGYENILKLSNDNYLLSGSSGYLKFDISKLREVDFEVRISSISQNRKNKEIVFLDRNEFLDFSSIHNNFHLLFSVNGINNFIKPQYQFKLNGIYDDWTKWSYETHKLLENLPPNDYKFEVRAKIGNVISKNIETYEFSVKKPWYLSNIMLFVYLIGVLLFSLLMHSLYKSYYKKQQRRLIELNQKELKIIQAENEKEIIKIRNEELKKSYKSKSKELATSIMSIVKKNELLSNIKTTLSNSNDSKAVQSIIKLIDYNLKKNDDWEFFQEAFNNADREFLKKLKVFHPNLSPNEIKLCAYLRLNLTSKEIAPLFNISTRSLEIKRYRLRKKLNLDSKQNLTNYILSI